MVRAGGAEVGEGFSGVVLLWGDVDLVVGAFRGAFSLEGRESWGGLSRIMNWCRFVDKNRW